MNTTEIRGVKLAKLAVNKILAHPETWDQRHWHCGKVKNGCHTTHCFGGWVQVAGGRPESDGRVERDVEELLEIGERDALWLCCASRTFFEIYNFVRQLDNSREGYTRYGYDLYGYDIDGYNRNGFRRGGCYHNYTTLAPFKIK